MKTFCKTIGVTAALTATTLGFTQGAEARDRWGRGGGGNDAAIAIGAGILGLAVGAAIADRGDNRYYDRGYYNNRRYVTVRGRPDYYYYYANEPRRYYRDRYYGRPIVYRDNWGRGGYGGGYGGNRWDRGYNDGRWDRGYGRGGYGRGDGRGYDRGYGRGDGRGYDRGYDRRDDRGYDRGGDGRDYRR